MKKLQWSIVCLSMAVTLTLLTGCSGKLNGPDESSNAPIVIDSDLSSDLPFLSDDSEASEPDGSSSETTPTSSVPESLADSDSKYSDAFDNNPINAAFDAEIKDATTTKDMQAVINKFAGIWEAEVTVAGKKAEHTLTGGALSQYRSSQEQWENNKETALNQMVDAIKKEFDGTTVALEVGQQTLSFYRARAREIYRMIYNASGKLPDLQYETAVG